MSATTAWSNASLDTLFGGTVYLALFTAAPTIAGGGTEVSGGSYARRLITYASAASRAKLSSAVLTFPSATGSWGTVTHYALFPSLTGGTMIAFDAFTSSFSVVSTEVVRVAVGATGVTLV